MKNSLRALYIGIIAVFFTQCSNENQLPSNLIIQDFVWKGLNAYYLHQDEIADLADLRFNSEQEINTYLEGFTDYNTLFTGLLIPTDQKSFLLEDYSDLNVDIPRTSITNGMEFGIIELQSGNILGYVTHILPNSYAATQSINRGDFFNSVDGTLLTSANFENLLVNGADSFTLSMVSFDGTTVTSNGNTVTLNKLSYTYSDVFLNKTITSGTDEIGYLMYNNNFSKISINSLNNTFLSLKNKPINELILDLRYNIGGGSFANSMTNLASMITDTSSDEILIKEKWNSKAQSWFESNEPNSLLTKFSNELEASTAINRLTITDVYIILNGENYTGSSAIELLINSLKPHINVHLIGGNTIGNNTGAITLYNSDDYNFTSRNESHTVALQPIVLSFFNKDNQTYDNGFTSNLALCSNEDVLTLGVLGEQSDSILNNVLNYISGTTNTAACNPNNYNYLYNSITSQREIDNGVFIEQTLPNTN